MAGEPSEDGEAGGWPAFVAVRHPSLAAAGLGRGAVTVRGAPDGLALAGEGGARLTLPWATIGKARVGAYSPKYGSPYYRMTLWSDAAAEPLRLETVHRDEPAFARIARALGARLAPAGGLEGGLGWRDALSNPLWLAGLMVLGFLAATHDPEIAHSPADTLPTALLFLGVTALLEIVMVRFYVMPYRPRRLRAVAELEAFLPGAPDPAG